MESKWGYKLTRKANTDLDEIVRYITTDLSNPKAAADFVDKLLDAIEEARLFPESGSLVFNEYLPNMDIRRKLVGNYIMYYLPDFGEETVYILRIVYGRRDMDEIMRQMNP